jgi:hypothetical protein
VALTDYRHTRKKVSEAPRHLNLARSTTCGDVFMLFICHAVTGLSQTVINHRPTAA